MQKQIINKLQVNALCIPEFATRSGLIQKCIISNIRRIATNETLISLFARQVQFIHSSSEVVLIVKVAVRLWLSQDTCSSPSTIATLCVLSAEQNK